ncbi:MAG: glycosyltransferase family 4 protein, partial [Pseudonocardiaceae bacterium]
TDTRRGREDALKVLIVINGLGTGGAERSLAEFLPALEDHDVVAAVAALHRRREGVEEAMLDQKADVCFVAGRSTARRVVELRRIITAWRPHLVHTTIFESDVVGRLAAMGGPPVLTSLVNTAYDPVRLADPHVRPARLKLVRMVDGWTARRLTTHFHAISRTVKESAVANLGVPANTITVIERGRNPARLGQRNKCRRAAVRAALGIPTDAEVVCNVGRQEYQKGQRYLLEAMRMIAGRRPRLLLLVAGRRGHASAGLEALTATPALHGRVRFLGHRDDVPDLLAAADLFAFPSLYEGLGGAVLEALGLGLPIVASDLPVLRETLEPGRTALLVPAQSPRELARAIEDLLDDPVKARAFGTRGIALFRDRFTSQRSTERMVRLYCSVATMRPKRPSGAPIASSALSTWDGRSDVDRQVTG